MQTALPTINRTKEDKISQIRQLAGEQDAVILAHNYQIPEVQQAADFVGDSLQLSRQAAEADAEEIVFCGVHFMAETASVLAPDKRVLIPDLNAGCSLADSITAEDLQAWKDKHPQAIVVMYVNTSAEVKALTDYCCTSSNALKVVEHIWQEYGDDKEILFGPDMWLGGFVARQLGINNDPRRADNFHVWSGECHVHAGIRPQDIENMRAKNPDAEFLVHPECGCSTQVMEYVASEDISSKGLHMLSTGQMLEHVRKNPHGDYIVATETGMLYGLQETAPDASFEAANPCAVCPFMKMTDLEKLEQALSKQQFEVKVDHAIAEKARQPIERMVSIG